MRLYHTPRTRSTRVLWALEETGAPFELTILDDDERRSEAHRARHPLGRVPVGEEDGEFVFESGALCLQVADSHPEANLIAPPGTRERALVYQWVFLATTEIDANFGDFARSGNDPARAEAAKERLRAAVAIIERALDGHDYLVGDRFTLADVVCGELLGVCRHRGLIDGFPRANEYVDRLEARPARKRADAAGAG